jgi:hypothetical protein
LSSPRRTAIRLGLAVVLGSATPLLADERQAQNWQEMSPQERGEAYRNYQRFQKMPPEQREKVERNYDRWQQMPPQQKERMRSTYREYREMPPKERRELDRQNDRKHGD